MGDNDGKTNVDEKHKILTFQIKFKGSLDEEFKLRKELETFVQVMKLNIFNFKARVLTQKEIKALQ